MEKFKHFYSYLGDDTYNLESWLDDFRHSGRKQLCYDVETTSLRWWDPKDSVVVIGLGYIGFDGMQTACVYAYKDPQLFFSLLQPVLEDASIAKIGANIKFDAHWAKRYGVCVSNLQDVQVMARLLRTQYFKVGLDYLMTVEFKAVHSAWQDLLLHAKEQKIRYNRRSQDDGVMARMDPELVSKYCAEDIYWTLRLAIKYFAEMQNEPKLLSMYKKIEQPLIEACLDMEEIGIRVDRSWLLGMQTSLAAQKQIFEQKIYDRAGMVFDIQSKTQLPKVLAKIGINPELRRRKKGEETTMTDSYDKRVLAKRADHPLVADILQYRTVNYLLTTYVENMLKHGSDRLHTSIRQEAARTGRMGATEPNLMGMPREDEEDEVRREHSIRKAILPIPLASKISRSTALVSIDLSGIEYRLLAHFSGDRVLCDLFKSGGDFHTYVGCMLFNVSKENLTKEQRAIGKKFNFAQLYGAGIKALAEQCKLSVLQVEKLQLEYRKKFPAVVQFKRDTEFRCKHYGGVRNPFGRFRKLPEDLAYRAVNTLIQSTAADVFKIAIVRIHRFLRNRKTKMLFPVHDEIVFNYAYEDGDIFKELTRCMTEFKQGGQSMFRVPLDTEVSICHENWKEKKSLELSDMVQGDLDKRVADHERKNTEGTKMPYLPQHLSC